MLNIMAGIWDKSVFVCVYIIYVHVCAGNSHVFIGSMLLCLAACYTSQYFYNSNAQL